MLQNVLNPQSSCSLSAFIYLLIALAISIFLGDRWQPWKSIFSILSILCIKWIL